MANLKERRIEFYIALIERQKEWIKSCGGDLSGYISRYGDPGISADDGKPMYGDGGTLIFQADIGALRRQETILANLKMGRGEREW